LIFTENALSPELQFAKELVYDKCGFVLKNLKENHESVEYNACSFALNQHKIEFRVSKITPTKTGQFVSIWKRNENGITEPFASSDDLDFIVITSKSGENLGQFIFPKSVLVEKGIISNKGKDGKRGIRVYPPWDKATNKQAEKTQVWQVNYFLLIKGDKSTDLNLARMLFNETLVDLEFQIVQ